MLIVYTTKKELNRKTRRQEDFLLIKTIFKRVVKTDFTRIPSRSSRLPVK